MVDLIPSSDTVMQMLKRTGAFREGHFVYPNGKHSPHYFQMPLAFRYYDTARVLAVALSRKFRLDRDISSQLPKVAIISPSSGGIPVAFGVRDELDRYLVGARKPGQGPGRKLGKLLIVALREIRPDLPYVLLNDVEIVEKPVACRTDVETALSTDIQLVVDAVEDIPRVLEPHKQRPNTSLLLRGEEVMPARDGTRSFTEALGT